jgi:nucleotide-binding universal stress UspA family protein
VLVRADETVEGEHMPDTEGRPSAHGPYREVVVGVDPAHRCEELLGFAFESAALRSTPLRVVHSASEAGAEPALAPMLQPWREKYPAVEVRELVGNGRVVQQLLHAAADACLLAVGRRIRPVKLGAHTGPVAHAVMHHVRCPVAVVPHE